MFLSSGLKTARERLWGKDCQKTAVLVLLILLCAGATYYFHFILRSQVVFSYLFYVPIVLAGFWWGRRGAWVAVLLGALLLSSHLLSGMGISALDSFLRFVMFVAVGLAVGVLREQTSRLEKNLRETRDYLDSLIRYANAPIIAWDPEGRIARFNQAFECLTGYTADEVIGRELPMLFPEASRDESLCKIARILSGEYWESVEIPILRKDRDIRLALWNSANIYAEDGTTLLATIAQGQDITERKRAEEALEQRAAQLALLNDIGERIAAVLELDSVLDRAARLVQESFGYHHVALFTLDRERGELVMSTRAGAFTDLFPLDHRLKLGQGIVGWAGLHGEALLANDVGVEPRYVNLYPDVIPTRSELSVPIRVGEEVVGVLDVQSPQLNAFDENDVLVMETLADQLAVAIQNARLFGQARQRARQLEALIEVGRAIGSILDLDEVLQLILERLEQVIPYDTASLWLREGDVMRIRAVRGFERPEAHLGLTVIFQDDALFQEMVSTRRPLILADAQQDERFHGLGGTEWVRSWLGVPLLSKGEVIGLATINKKEPGLYTAETAELVLAFGQQAAMAIENARLYREAMQRLKETETLSAVTTTLTRSLDLDQRLQSIVDSATRLIPASTGGVIHLVDEATGKLIPWATSAPEVNIQQKLEMSIGEGIAGLVVQEKRLINVPNVEEDPRFLVVDIASSKKSLLTAPLMIDGDCLGALSLNSDQVGAFDADAERLLTTLAAQAAVAVRNARLHQEVQRRVEELTLLSRVGRAVTSSLDLEQVLKTVMEETALVLRVEAGSILLLDEERSELVFGAAVGPRAEEVKGLRLPLGQGIAGWVAREGRRLLVPNVREDPRFYSGIDEATGFVTKSLLAVPLKVRGTVIGVIEAVNKSEGNFSQEDGALLSSMARWAAIAIENAQLFTETRRHFEEMAALHDVSLDITARLEMPGILKSVVERAVELLRADAGAVCLYDQEREELRLAIGCGYTEKYDGVTLKPGEGMAGKVFQSGEPMIIDDYHTWEGRAAVFEADQAFTAVLEVPLKWQGRIMGVLAIAGDVQKRTFNQDDVWLATLFANQAAIAIEKARLFEQAQREIAERKRVEEVLRESEERYRSIADNIQDGLTIIGEGKVVYVNDRACEIFGYPRDELVKLIGLDIAGPEEKERLHRGKAQVEQTGIRPKGLEFWIIRKDGTRRCIHNRYSLIRKGDEIVARLVVTTDITERKRAEEALCQQAEQLRTLAARLAEAEEIERQRLARELHDQVGQNLTALGINLNIVRSQMPEEAADLVRSCLDDSLALVEQTTERIRSVMADLRPPVLDDYGLVAALRWYGEQFASRMGIAVDVQGKELDPRLPARVENALFRIAQEALTNVTKHAQATQVMVAVEVDDETARLVVADNGVGFELTEPDERRGWGLLTMTERAEAVGGRCHIESRPAQGTKVTVEVPR